MGGMTGKGKGGSSDNSAAQAAMAERARVQAAQGRVDSAFSQFDDPFYSGRKQAYIDYYQPEFTAQQQQAHDDLVASLASRGLLGGSEGARQESLFTKSSDDAWAKILSGAKDYENGLRASISGSKNSMYGLAGATGDAALDKAVGEQVALASSTPSFSPVGQLFANYSTPVTMGVASQGGFGAQQGGVQGAVTPGGGNKKSQFLVT